MNQARNLRAVTDQVFTTQNFTLESGQVLPELKIAYETYGVPAPDLGNVVLLTHGYTSSHRMVGADDGTLAEGVWSGLVGPGKAIDTDRFFVLSSNMLGSAYGSTGPAHLNPSTDRPYGPDFPDISLVDIVTAQRALLDSLDIGHLVAVAGPSYGGFQAFQWAVTFPGYCDAIVPVTTAPKRGSEGMARIDGLAATFAKDPNWNGGDYYDRGGITNTLAKIRFDTLVSYGIHEQLTPSFPEPAARDAEIERVAYKWATEFDANSLIVLGRASARFDVEDELSRIQARVLYVLSRTDKIFPPALGPDVMTKLQAAGVDAEYAEIDSELGHAAPGLDGAKWAAKLGEFMDGLTQRC